MQEIKEKKLNYYQENILEKCIIKGRGLLNNIEEILQIWVFENILDKQKKLAWKTITRQ